MQKKDLKEKKTFIIKYIDNDGIDWEREEKAFTRKTVLNQYKKRFTVLSVEEKEENNEKRI